MDYPYGLTVWIRTLTVNGVTNRTALISGASVAGPSLAYFLHRSGYDVTVVERAAKVRYSGYAVDFRGAAFDVLDEMGILNEIRDHNTRMRGVTQVDDNGVAIGHLSAETFSGELEIPKRHLTRILHGVTADDVEYVFGNSITALVSDEAGVTVEFERGRARRFDLVFGADGIHSNVRRLAFSPDTEALRHLGMSVAAFSTANRFGLDRSGLLHAGRDTMIYVCSTDNPDRVTVTMSFATDAPDLDRWSRARQHRAVRRAFAGYRWEVPHMLEAMSRADDFYFISISQIHLNRWSQGRIALLGDAGYCAAPTSGMGTSQALIGARTLARQLATTNGDHETAFAAYEGQLRPYIADNQKRGLEAARRHVR